MTATVHPLHPGLDVEQLLAATEAAPLDPHSDEFSLRAQHIGVIAARHVARDRGQFGSVTLTERELAAVCAWAAQSGIAAAARAVKP